MTIENYSGVKNEFNPMITPRPNVTGVHKLIDPNLTLLHNAVTSLHVSHDNNKLTADKFPEYQKGDGSLPNPYIRADKAIRRPDFRKQMLQEETLLSSAKASIAKQKTDRLREANKLLAAGNILGAEYILGRPITTEEILLKKLQNLKETVFKKANQSVPPILPSGRNHIEPEGNRKRGAFKNIKRPKSLNNSSASSASSAASSPNSTVIHSSAPSLNLTPIMPLSSHSLSTSTRALTPPLHTTLTQLPPASGKWVPYRSPPPASRTRSKSKGRPRNAAKLPASMKKGKGLKKKSKKKILRM